MADYEDDIQKFKRRKRNGDSNDNDMLQMLDSAAIRRSSRSRKPPLPKEVCIIRKYCWL